MKKKKKKNNKFKKIIKELNTDSKFSIFEVVIIVFISNCFGVLVGYILTYTNSNINKIRNDSNLEDIVVTYNEIVNNYYKDVDKKKLSEGAISGMTSVLNDPNTVYMNNNTTDVMKESLDGTFKGIGVTIQYEDEYNKVIEVEKNGPADKAGLKKGDIILSIDGTDCKGLYGNKITKLIRDNSKSKIVIVVKRNEEEKKFTVTKDDIEIKSVSYRLFEEDNRKIGYIEISVFASNTSDQFNEALKKVEEKKIDSLIIDLRGNPGGYLDVARKSLSMFFDKKTVLYQVVDKNSSKKKVYSLSNDKREYPIVLLGDASSASSSEVVISCFKDNYKDAIFIGETTYGKGTIQNSQSLKSGNNIKYTIDRWLTSKGKSIEGKGISPDIEVKISDEYSEKPIIENDNQLQMALEEIKKNH